MSITIWGGCAEVGGASCQVDRLGFLRSAASYRDVSPMLPSGGAILDIDHDGDPIGVIVHAERDGDRVNVVAVADDDDLLDVLAEQPAYFSGSFLVDGGDQPERVQIHDVVYLRSVGLVLDTARVGASPVRCRPGDVREARRSWPSNWLSEAPLLQRASSVPRGEHATWIGERRPPAAITHDERRQPAGQVEIRSAQLAEVRHADRIIELVVAPYESEAQVPYAGRWIREVFARGAFKDVEQRTSQVRVNRDHDPQRTVGRAISLDPDRREGLVAHVRISRTELGDETLTLAAEGILDASAGFRLPPGSETWHDNRSLRRLHRVELHHIALTPDPAYEDARVLAVRHGPTSATPRLDRVLEWQRQHDAAALIR